MGKSGKKSKSDKIWALRKRYDAFLEEDKQRKERNDYILERLEKMRSCTTLVQVRSKGYSKSESDYQGPTMSNITINVPRPTYAISQYKNNDEPSILKEISKKYILIPKVYSNIPKNLSYNNDRTSQDHSDPSPSSSGDNDWKSKYSILDELKTEEKEGKSELTFEKSHKVDNFYQNINNDDYVSKENIDNSKYEIKATDSVDISSNKLEGDKKLLNKETRLNKEDTNYNEHEENIQRLSYQEPAVLIAEKEEIALDKHGIDNEITSMSNNLLSDSNQVEEIKQDKISYLNKTEEGLLKNDHCEKLAHEQPIKVIGDNKNLSEEKECREIDDKLQENVVYSTTNIANNLSPIVKDESVDMERKEEIAFAYESNEYNPLQNQTAVRAQDANEDVVAPVKESAENITVHQEYEQHEQSNVTPVQNPQIHNLQPNITSDVNDEFEAEQKEMFYDQTDDAYNQNDASGYSQDNENYSNQQYSYYDEAQKEQIYPIEINEHEESTERYDPNYEQQYINNYEETVNTTEYQTNEHNAENNYDQQQIYDQQDVNYQDQQNYEYVTSGNDKDKEASQSAYYDNVQENNIQYEATDVIQPELGHTQEVHDTQNEYIIQEKTDAIENIEQQLDIDDGYIPNIVQNQDSEDVIEDISSEIKQPDVNVT